LDQAGKIRRERRLSVGTASMAYGIVQMSDYSACVKPVWTAQNRRNMRLRLEICGASVTVIMGQNNKLHFC
jgi:hypothetical protein